MFKSLDWLAIPMCILALIALPLLSTYMDGKTAQEAIKAGLVQDKDKHWVKPDVSKEQKVEK